MLEDFECNCIYVEIANESVQGSGRVEYRAKQCSVCQAFGSLLRADGKMPFAIDPTAPRYQRTH